MALRYCCDGLCNTRQGRGFCPRLQPPPATGRVREPGWPVQLWLALHGGPPMFAATRGASLAVAVALVGAAAALVVLW